MSIIVDEHITSRRATMWDKDGPKTIKIVTVRGRDGDMVSRTPIGTTIELSWLKSHHTHQPYNHDTTLKTYCCLYLFLIFEFTIYNLFDFICLTFWLPRL